jgi:tetratricopeptide (TPR) repeat protein
VLVIPMAAGLSWIRSAVLRGPAKWRGLATRKPIAIASMIGVLLVPIAVHGRENNMRHYWYAHDHAQSMLDCMLPNALVFPSGDHNTFPLIYLVEVEGVRPDVRIADKYGYIELDLYRDMPNNPGKPRTREQREAIESWLIRTSKCPVYFTTKRMSPVPNAKVVLAGVIYHLLPEGYDYDEDDPWSRIAYRNIDGIDAPIDHAAMNIVADYYHARGLRAAESGDMAQAKAEFDRVLEWAWGMREIHNNVASALAETDDLDGAIAIYETAAKMDWTYAPARWNLARIFKSLQKYDWAASIFEDLTRASPGDFRPYGELGFLKSEWLGRPDEARFWWYESLRIQPDQPQIIAALARQMESKADTGEVAEEEHSQ